MFLRLLSSVTAWSTFLNLLILTHWIPASALDWVPTAEEMATYRHSWNPPTHGTSYTSSPDVARQGQWCAGICARHDRIRRVATYGHFAKRRLSVQPGCSHAGGHVVLRSHPPPAGWRRHLCTLPAF